MRFNTNPEAVRKALLLYDRLGSWDAVIAETDRLLAEQRVAQENESADRPARKERDH